VYRSANRTASHTAASSMILLNPVDWPPATAGTRDNVATVANSNGAWCGRRRPVPAPRYTSTGASQSTASAGPTANERQATHPLAENSKARARQSCFSHGHQHADVQ
jgi:hypothetical protein